MDSEDNAAREIETEALLDRMRLPVGQSYNADDNIARICSVIANRTSLLMQSMYGERFGLNVLNWRILAILGYHSPISAKTISEMIATDQVTISRAIDQMSRKKLISRRVDQSDRRRQLLRLSDRGQEVYQRVLPLFAASESALLAPLSEDEQAELRRLLHIVAKQAETEFSETKRWQDVLSAYGKPGGTDA